MLIKFVIVAAGFFDVVEGAVGLAEDGGQVALASCGTDGDADAGSDVAGSPTDNEPAGLFKDDFGNPAGIGLAGAGILPSRRGTCFSL